ncbi:hypothetical protein ACIBJF_48700 [Streptomyces sp. NPDC050743]|uniref:hypothetical protein n=1 Tax=Streptomyces sp. NPDC050743 TaxID=3365634 RepID=UPI0037B280F6
MHVIVHEVHPEPSLYACPDCGGRWPRGRPASADPVRKRALPYLRVRKRSAVRTGQPGQTTPDKEGEDPVHLEDTITSPYARVERNESSGTYSIVVISEQPGNADTVEVLAVPDLPSGIVPGEEAELDALVCDAAEGVLLDASYELTSAWRAVGDRCYLVGVSIPDRVFEKQDERLRAAEAAVEGLESVDRTGAEALFETAETTPDGDLGSAYELDEWLEKEVNVAFYRTADGRLLARPADRFEQPSTKLFSARYRSASLVAVFPNPRPMQTVLDHSHGDVEESDDDLDDECGQAPQGTDGSGDGDTFPLLCADADVSWPPVQRLNARRARQFLLVSLYDRDRAELRWYDQLLARGHALAFYAGAGPDPRELIIRHYGGPRPGILPMQPPQTLGQDDDAYRLVAIYEGPPLFGKDWRHAVSTMPLESFLTVCVSPVKGEEAEYALCVRDGVLQLLRDEGLTREAVTVLGTPSPGSDPLALALTAVPDLLTFPPTAAMDISASAPHAVADAIRFTSSPAKNTWGDLYGEDWDDYECANEDFIRRHDDLTPLRLDVNGTPHLAATVDGDWVVIPVDDEEIQLNRGFLEVLYDFEGGGISSGRGSQSIGEVRPGLNAYWEDFSEENWDRDLTLSRGDLVRFAVEQAGNSRFVANVVHALIGGLDEVPEAALEGDLEHYENVMVFAGFAPDDEEGLTFFRAVGDRYGNESAVHKRIDEYLAEIARPDIRRLMGQPCDPRDLLTMTAESDLDVCGE